MRIIGVNHGFEKIYASYLLSQAGCGMIIETYQTLINPSPHIFPMGSIQTYLKTVGFTILVPGTVAVLIPQILGRWRRYPTMPINENLARTGGALSLISGIVLYGYTAFQFGSEGKGTPSPSDEPEELVTSGIYAHSRNPMYIAVLLVILGQALRQRSVAILWWGFGMWIGFHNRVIGYEEPHLAEKHGEAYEAYRESVPRWFARW